MRVEQIGVAMRVETIHGICVPKVGLGTWTMGGESNADPSRDDASLAALRSALELGYTHFDTAEAYAAGHCEELVGQAILEVGIAREKLFITTKVSPEHLGYEMVLKCCESSLRRLQMEYLDLYLIHWPRYGMRLEETFRALNRLVNEGKVRWLGVSNFNLKLLKEAVSQCETPLLSNQVSYSIPDKTSVENGVVQYCQENDILIMAYSPVKRRNIASNKVLETIAHERGLTRQQIALAWLTTQPRVITIPMSLNPLHQADNLAVGEVVLSSDEIERLSNSV